MNIGFAKATTILLLLAQVWVGFARGQTICIPLARCADHVALVGCNEPESDLNETDRCSEADDEGPVVLRVHEHPICGCHVHVQMSDERPLTPDRSTWRVTGDGAETPCQPTALACLEWGADAGTGPVCRGRSPGDASSAPMTALRTTRLRI